VPLTLVHTGKYRTEDKIKNTDNTETKHYPKKQTTQNTAKNYPGSQLPFMTLGQESRWAYSTMLPSPHGAFQLEFSSVLKYPV